MKSFTIVGAYLAGDTKPALVYDTVSATDASSALSDFKKQWSDRDIGDALVFEGDLVDSGISEVFLPENAQIQKNPL